MKSAIFAALLLVSALPAAAQSRGAAAAPSALVNSGGGSGGGLSGGFGGSGFGAVSFASASSSPAVQFPIICVRGSEATFVPTRFVPFAEALKMGLAALAYKPKTIAEVAAEYRASKAKLAQKHQ